jgi:hypothetical protein
LEENQNTALPPPQSNPLEVQEISEPIPFESSPSAPVESKEETIQSFQLQPPNSQPQTPSMEVQKHPHHVMHKKKWGEYLLEFLMLFLAVFLGFVAENIRENVVENRRGREYIKSFYEDLTADETTLQTTITNLAKQAQTGDSLFELMKNVGPATTANRIYMFLLSLTRSSATNLYVNDRTIVQLRNAGGMRLIHNKAISDSIVDYYKEIETIQFLYEELLNLKRGLREKYPSLLNASDYAKVQARTTEIINPAEPIYLRTTDADVINDCLVRIHDVKGLCGGLALRIGRLKDRVKRIKEFIKQVND